MTHVYERHKNKSLKKIENQIDKMPPILSPAQLNNLSNHKYSSQGVSVLDGLFQPFWRWSVEQLPMNIAPNMITLIGLALNLVTCSMVMFYSPDGKQNVPPWVLVLCAIGLFLYQTLDAIDGKQARRTGSSSPLGELFDHGCDAISTIFVSISLCVSLRLSAENPWLTYITFVLALATFYVAHWQTYITGTLKFGKFDCTEAQVSIYIIYLLTAFFGDAFWQIKVPILNIDLRYIPFLISLVGSVVSISKNLFIISKGGIGKHGSSVANTSIIFPALPLLLVYTLQLMMANKSADQIFFKYPCLYLLACGILWSKYTIKLIVAHMTKGELHLFDSCLYGPGILLIDQYFNFIIPEYYVLIAFLLFNVYDLIAYCSKVCLQICCHLNIYLLKITPKPPASTTSDNNNNNTTTTAATTTKSGYNTRSSKSN